jgi:hypothetical protein
VVEPENIDALVSGLLRFFADSGLCEAVDRIVWRRRSAGIEPHSPVRCLPLSKRRRKECVPELRRLFVVPSCELESGLQGRPSDC